MKTSTWLLSRVLSYSVVLVFTVFFSNSYAQQIGVLGNSQYIADNDTTPSTTDFTDFNSQTSRTFFIDNVQTSGNTTLTVSSISLSNTTDFSISSGLADNTITKSQAPEPFTISLLTASPGTYTSTVTIASDASNDGGDNVWIYSITATVVPTYGQPQYTLYYENFDVNNGGWTVVTSTNDSWTWTNTFPTTELGEGSFWRNTNFNNYTNNTDIVIQSPQLDFTGLQNIQLSLDVKYKTENNVDGMIIQYSVAGGAYVTLGASGSGTNWYEDNASVFGTDAWNGDGHTSTPSFNPHNQFSNARITLTDAIFANQNNVRFRIQFRSSSSGTNDGVAFDNFRIEADPSTALNSASIAPANITGDLRLWLKTNAGVSVSDGAALTNWEDQAYDTALDKEDASASSALAPTYRDNGNRNINYNPVVDFDHNNTEYMNGKGGFYSRDYFVVVRSDDDVDTSTGSFVPGRQFAIGGRFASIAFHEDPTGLGLGSTTGRYSNEVISHN
ncbi:MAG: hypothetical protein KJO77_01270, partial [Bacteroidia bacterium]|nr:hypothetical protein [Bacteroidia bacterium]